MPITFAHTPDPPPGPWAVTLPPDASIGEVLVYAEPIGPVVPDSPAEFDYVGHYEEWVVPAGLDTITLELWSGQSGEPTAILGSYLKADADVTGDEVLRIYVGGQGGHFGAGGLGGWPDGGRGSFMSGFAAYRSGGGAGSTQVRRSPYADADILAVVGGPGSSGGEDNPTIAPGGMAGNPNGHDGSCSVFPSRVGGGATPSTPGAGGTGGTADGSAGVGMFGANAPGSSASNSDAAPGAGGGGLRGGGSGAAGGGLNNAGGGGGGGSSGVPDATQTDFDEGVRTGDGHVTISWT